MKQIDIVCHKGANAVAPENTYAAAQRCIEWGMDYVEIDVRTSQDGVLYLLHDATLERTTNGTGYLHERSSTYLDQLDAGSWFHPNFADQRLPRLEPFLRWIKGKAKIFFDVKAADARQLTDLVYATDFAHDCFFWSGSNVWAKELRALAPELALKINVRTVEDLHRAYEEFRPEIVEVGLEHMNDALLAACRVRNIKVMIYHQRAEPDAFRQILSWGADMVNLNHGDLFAQVLREYNEQRPI
ncbi:MAG: glycerophosphodiester phosphodiesterase family protein [Caldilineaceae bacterium]|nr:glycerophosphodiester phosphodiesterase family protein [Caldilineaceae bacterium]